MLHFKELKLAAICAHLFAIGAAAQNVFDRQTAVEGIATRPAAPASLSPGQTGQGSPAQDSSATGPSDAGLQRVVTEKERSIEFEAGTTFSYLYRSNPLSTNGALSKVVKSGVSDLGSLISLSLGNYELLNGVFTPRIGGGMSEVSLSKRILDFVDYRTQRGFLQGDLRYSNGWTLSSSLEYSSLRSSKFDTEDYKEWFPSLLLAKGWAIDDKSLVRAAVSSGYRFSEVDSLGDAVPGLTANRLDNWSNSLSVSYYRELFFGLTPQVFAELSNRSYHNGQNRNRNDFSKTVGSSVAYNWRILRFSIFWNYTDRESSLQINEYRNLDAGASISATVRF